MSGEEACGWAVAESLGVWDREEATGAGERLEGEVEVKKSGDVF